MNITIIKEDNVVVVDGEAMNFDFILDNNIWAIQWNGTTGEVEYKDNTPNLEITSFDEYQYLVDGFNTEKQRLEDVAAQEAADAEAALTYSDRRKPEYPAIGDQLDALFHAGVFPAEMAQQIQAVKNKYPKELVNE